MDGASLSIDSCLAKRAGRRAAPPPAYAAHVELKLGLARAASNQPEAAADRRRGQVIGAVGVGSGTGEQDARSPSRIAALPGLDRL